MCARSRLTRFQVGVAETFDVIVTPRTGPTALFPRRSTARAWAGRRSLRAKDGRSGSTASPAQAADHDRYGHGHERHGGMQGMSGMSDESPVKERGWIPLWCRMPRAICEAHWLEGTDRSRNCRGRGSGGRHGRHGP
jgi:hypothetical protein